jgi:hypothetical protein
MNAEQARAMVDTRPARGSITSGSRWKSINQAIREPCSSRGHSAVYSKEPAVATRRPDAEPVRLVPDLMFHASELRDNPFEQPTIAR